MNIQSALVKSILEHWDSYKWTVQGFGFLRTKIEDVGRIHIWDSRLRVPLVSDVHTHPWPLKSTIISGELINCRFITTPCDSNLRSLPYTHSSIATGEGGGLIGDTIDIELFACKPELYLPSQVYHQAPIEIHRTIARDGTITLLERPQGPPLEEAVVYWPSGTHWVSAEPRPSNYEEARDIIQHALSVWYPA